MHNDIHRILVPVDFSASSLAAVDFARTVSARFGSTVDLLYVSRRNTEAAWERAPLAMFARTAAGKEMKRLLSTLDMNGVAVAHGRLEFGNPGEAILEVAAEGYDLIVMGAHAHKGLGHLLGSSVAERVVRHAPCPVLTIRADEPC